MKIEITYLPDDSIGDVEDQEIRRLLTTCFINPQDVVFKDRRYFREPYPHRWIIRDPQGALVAHIGVHDKQASIDDSTFRIGGICEVCVHPDHRGQGYVRIMLKHIHAWLSEHGFVFTILFGNPPVYRSSAYVPVTNLFIGGEDKAWTPVVGMIRELSKTPWPSDKAHIPRQEF